MSFNPSSGGGPPSAHATTHQDGGSDELNVVGLSGLLADTQHPIIGALGTEAVAGNDIRLTNARVPTAHATTHQSAGADELSVLLLGGFPGGTSNFLRADGSFSAPTASVADPNQQAYAPGAFTLVTGKYAIMARRLTLTSTQRVVGQGTACLREL